MIKNREKITVESNQKRNYNPLIWVLSILAIVVILGINYIPRSTSGTIFGMEITVLPLFNAIINGVTLLLLVLSLIYIKQKNITAHRRLIYAAFDCTFFFLLSYLK